jgi:hypothetical protein
VIYFCNSPPLCTCPWWVKWGNVSACRGTPDPLKSLSRSSSCSPQFLTDRVSHASNRIGGHQSAVPCRIIEQKISSATHEALIPCKLCPGTRPAVVMAASSATMAPAIAPNAERSATAPISRKFKASDLPLTSAVRSAIEGLAHSFKKKGGYDEIRKQAWDSFEASVSHR